MAANAAVDRTTSQASSLTEKPPPHAHGDPGTDVEEEGGGDGGRLQPYQTKYRGIDAELDKSLDRQFDKRVVPWLFGLWLLAFIDRTNIGNAKIAGLPESAGLAPTSTQFNIALAVFYIPYILVDVPSNWVVKYFRAGYYLPTLLICWGLVSLCTGFVTSFAGLIVARLFLGLFEGGLLGGMIIYLAMFYKRHQLLYRIGLFYCAAPGAGAIGGVLATGLAKISSGSYVHWPFIFFVEGAITILYGVLCLFFMPHTPSTCKFLSEEQRQAAIDRMQEDSQGASQKADVNDEEFDWHWVKMALLNTNTQLLSLLFFAIITPIYSYSLFLPSIIQQLVKDSTRAQAFTIPPNVLGFISVLVVAHYSDKTKVRGYFMVGGIIVAMVGYIMLIATPNIWVEYAGTFLVAAGIFPCSPLVMGWIANNLAPHFVRATGTGYQIGMANLAAFIATFTYVEKDKPRYITGHAINLGTLGLALVVTIVTIFYNKWENKQRRLGKRDHRLESTDESKLGDHHPRYVYTI